MKKKEIICEKSEKIYLYDKLRLSTFCILLMPRTIQKAMVTVGEFTSQTRVYQSGYLFFKR